MSVRHGTAAPSHPQSLPSFAQAFSNSSLDRLSAHNNALPPIQSPSPFDPSADPPPSIDALPQSSSDSDPRPPRRNGRKRSHPDGTPASRDEQSSDPTRQSPRLVRVKEEQDELIDDPSPPPRPPRSHSNLPLDSSAAAAPPSSKKRRVTISGAAHPPDSTQPHPPDSTQPSSMSSMVIGLPIMRDDPAALEQVRSMLTIKQNQKALIEQRRGSLAGLSTPPLHPSVSVIHPTNAPKPQLGPATRVGPIARSPNLGAPRMRSSIVVANDPSSSARQPSPTGSLAPNQQQPPVPPHTHSAHAPPENPASSHPPHPPAPPQPTPIPNVLPPPPISFSFARRRGGAAGKKKPADIVISPRDVQSDARLQPVIQSAPPVPQGAGAGGLAAMSGRFPMALPSLPPVLGAGQSMRRVAPGNVPPTPTRLSMRGSIAAAPAPASSLLGPSASVPIATTLVPPTPAALHHPGYAADKASFLAPFEVFYDALRDAKELKAYLAEQLHKASALAQSMQAQQERLDLAVDAAVERRMGAAAEEVAALRRRVEELEDTLHAARGEGAGLARRRSLAPGDANAQTQTQAGRGRTAPFRGGAQHAQPPPTPQSAFLGAAPESYTFPPVDPAPRAEASGASPKDRDRDRDRDADGRNGAASARMNGGSPVPLPYDLGRRLSISSVRMDPPPPPPPSQHPQSQSQPQPQSQSQSQSSHPPESASASAGASGAKGSAKGGKGAAATQRAVRFPERPAPPSRRLSAQHHQQQQGEGEEQGQRAERKSPAAGRRPSSVVGASPKSRPESPMDESGA